MKAILSIRKVSKSYQDGQRLVSAVQDVSVDLLDGELLLVKGPSGSGKTTLLSIMGCILRPSAGEVFVLGQNVTTMSERRLPLLRRTHFGFVFQSFNLFPSLTAVENVELALRMRRWRREQLRAEGLRLLDKVELGRRADFLPSQLSGGEKQRVAFARALAGNPPILLADEPTASLDAATGRSILEILRRLAEEDRKAVAVVSHDHKAEQAAHRVVHMEDGRLTL
jgi:putative ABC transport system ATP-binding protein